MTTSNDPKKPDPLTTLHEMKEGTASSSQPKTDIA
jgi:hypothetical protein